MPDGENVNVARANAVNDAILPMNDLAQIGTLELRNFPPAFRKVGQALNGREQPLHDPARGSRVVFRDPLTNLNHPLDLAELMDSMTEALEHAKGKRDLRTTVLPAAPKPMNSAAVRRLRSRLNASQAVFASYLNVSTKLVQAWESDRRTPEGAALRLLARGDGGRRRRTAPHLDSFARSSSKKPCTTTREGVPAMSSHRLSRTMRKR